MWILASECVSEQGKAICSQLGGQCIIEKDGYYLTTGLCIAFAVAFALFYVVPTVRRLEGKQALGYFCAF
jgi:MFS transporter, PAT family, solute carrier family 33 (acetyl-CoA transportor), member 1